MIRTFVSTIMAASVVALAAAGLLTPTAVAAASGPHWCRQGDPPLYASARTSCPLAGSIITDYVNVCHKSRECRMMVGWPIARTRYAVTCRRTGPSDAGTVGCDAAVGSGVWARFSSDI